MTKHRNAMLNWRGRPWETMPNKNSPFVMALVLAILPILRFLQCSFSNAFLGMWCSTWSHSNPCAAELLFRQPLGSICDTFISSVTESLCSRLFLSVFVRPWGWPGGVFVCQVLTDQFLNGKVAPSCLHTSIQF